MLRILFLSVVRLEGDSEVINNSLIECKQKNLNSNFVKFISINLFFLNKYIYY